LNPDRFEGFFVSLSLSEANRRRLVASLIAEELGRLRQKEVPPAESLAWLDETVLGEGDSGKSLGLDSLGRMDVAARLNQFFHLHEVGIEDYLLVEKTLGRWSAIVAEGARHRWERVTFQTSGSTGAPKACTHLLADIADEARELVHVLSNPRRIISLVPPHHIYGFIFTVALPEIMGIDVVDARALSPGRLKALLVAGDVIVATPHLWRYLATSLPAFPAGVRGTTSTAPMPAELARELKTKGLESLTEIYGSSETAGIAWRQDPSAPFTLFDAWQVSVDEMAINRRRVDGSVADAIPFNDIVRFEGPRLLRPMGRRDGAVQVGGVNVFPERVRKVLEDHDAVQEAAVRAFAVGGDEARQRLKAFVVTDRKVDVSSLEQSLRHHVAETLSDVERPVAYTFGHTLPRNAMGKLADWS
jgi:long-chain acyl-CoA synthetase